MKKLALFLMIFAIPAICMAERAPGRRRATLSPGLAKVCSSVTSLSRQFLYKAEISHHIPGGDARAAGPTLICNQQCPQFPASVFYSDGKLAHQFGYYGKWDVTGKSRAYCAAGGAPACSVSSVSRNARASRRNGKVYVQMRKGRGPCIEVNNPSGRNGTPT